MNDIIKVLQDKDDKKAYALSKEIETKSANSDEYSSFFDEFVSLLTAKSSYVRTRGFILCCAQARWDREEKITKALPDMFRLLHDEKPTVVRQCINALHEVASFKPELCETIHAEHVSIDLSKYKDSIKIIQM